jgi:hypothetical protein
VLATGDAFATLSEPVSRCACVKKEGPYSENKHLSIRKLSGWPKFGDQQCLIATLRVARIALDGPLSSSSLGDEKRVSSLVLRSAARDPGVDCDAPLCLWLAALAAMFAGKPPSSSDPTKRFCRRTSSALQGVSSAPPAHSSPLGLVLAALAPFLGDRRREHRGRGSRSMARCRRPRSETKSVSPHLSSDQRRAIGAPR